MKTVQQSSPKSRATKTRSIYFWHIWYGRPDVVGYMIPTATVAETLRELRKYEAAFPCFTICVGVDPAEEGAS